MFSQWLQIQLKSPCIAKKISNEWQAQIHQEYLAEDLFITGLSNRITSKDIHWSKTRWLPQSLCCSLPAEGLDEHFGLNFPYGFLRKLAALWQLCPQAHMIPVVDFSPVWPCERPGHSGNCAPANSVNVGREGSSMLVSHQGSLVKQAGNNQPHSSYFWACTQVHSLKHKPVGNPGSSELSLRKRGGGF